MIACEKATGGSGVAQLCFGGRPPPCFAVADAGWDAGDAGHHDADALGVAADAFRVADIGFGVAIDAFIGDDGHHDTGFSVADAGFRDADRFDGVANLGFVMPDKKSRIS